MTICVEMRTTGIGQGKKWKSTSNRESGALEMIISEYEESRSRRAEISTVKRVVQGDSNRGLHRHKLSWPTSAGS